MATGRIEAFSTDASAWQLIANVAITNTATTHTTYDSRRFDNFDLLLFVVKRGNYIKISSVVPRTLFEQTTLDFSERDTANQHRWYDFTYISQTSVKIQCSDNVSDGNVWIYGIGPSIMSLR